MPKREQIRRNLEVIRAQEAKRQQETMQRATEEAERNAAAFLKQDEEEAQRTENRWLKNRQRKKQQKAEAGTETGSKVVLSEFVPPSEGEETAGSSAAALEPITPPEALQSTVSPELQAEAAQDEEEGEFQLGEEAQLDTAEEIQEVAADGEQEGEKEIELEAEEGEEATAGEEGEFSLPKSKRAKRAEGVQEKTVKMAHASVRLSYEFSSETQPLYSGRLWKTIPELETSDQWRFAKDSSKSKNKKDIDLSTETTLNNMRKFQINSRFALIKHIADCQKGEVGEGTCQRVTWPRLKGSMRTI